MDRNDKPKRIIVLGGNPDPAPQAWLGQKGHITQRGAAPHVNEHTSIHHRPHNPIIPKCLVRWLFSSSNQRPASPHSISTQDYDHHPSMMYGALMRSIGSGV